VAVFAIAAGLAGLGGALFGSLQGSVGTPNFTIFSGVMFLLFLVVWNARTISGAFLAALTFAIFTNVAHLTQVEGIFAGAGIILIGRSANGILGLDWLAERVRLPWVRPDRPATLPELSGMLEGNAGATG
jgi:branched-chain amino acid transport system permease protein